MRPIASGIFVLLLSFSTSIAAADHRLSDYVKTTGVDGNLSSVGSDTLAHLMSLWAEAFKRYYPNVNIQIQAAGSSTAPPALTEATSNLGPMSRQMKKDELEAFERKYGYPPTAIRVAVDALAIYVNKDNPLDGLTIQQLDAIFSSTRKCGQAGAVTTWGQVGLKGEWTNKPMQLFGRNSVSGTYGYFKKKALCKGDFKNNVNEQLGSASVVQSVTVSLNSIGYSGIGYRTSGVKTLAIAKKPTRFVSVNADTAATGQYPLARFLYVYVNKHPNKPLSPLEREFFKMILSQQGQDMVLKDGYVPLPVTLLKKEWEKLQ